MKTSLRCFCKTSRRCLEDVLGRLLEGVLKISWRLWPRWIYLEVIRTHDQCKYNCLDQDVWGLLKTKTMYLFRTSSRLLYENKCLLGAEPIVKENAEKPIFEATSKQTHFRFLCKIAVVYLITKEFRNYGHCYRNYMMTLPKPPTIKHPTIFSKYWLNTHFA